MKRSDRDWSNKRVERRGNETGGGPPRRMRPHRQRCTATPAVLANRQSGKRRKLDFVSTMLQTGREVLADVPRAPPGQADRPTMAGFTRAMAAITAGARKRRD